MKLAIRFEGQDKLKETMGTLIKGSFNVSLTRSGTMVVRGLENVSFLNQRLQLENATRMHDIPMADVIWFEIS